MPMNSRLKYHKVQSRAKVGNFQAEKLIRALQKFDALQLELVSLVLHLITIYILLKISLSSFLISSDLIQMLASVLSLYQKLVLEPLQLELPKQNLIIL